jgi:hypothetical protein
MKLLFPFSWEQWQLGFLQSEDYNITILASISAVVVYGIYYYYEKRKLKQQKDI